MLREGETWREISYEEAYAIIAEKVKAKDAEKTAVFGGARLTNEEQYLVQKLAREAIGTKNIGNFHYLGRAKGYRDNSIANTPFKEIEGASKIIIIGAELINDHDYVGYLVNHARTYKSVPVEFISTNEHTNMLHKVDSELKIKDYYAFVQAANHYLLANEKQNELFINGRTNGFEDYKASILAKDFAALCEAAGVEEEAMRKWAEGYNIEMNAILIFSEHYISGACSRELFNLAMISGKLGKTSNGVIPLKTKNNAQGLFDMGVFPCLKPGTIFDDSVTPGMMLKKLKGSAFDNMFIFGEDPVGTAIDQEEVRDWIMNTNFIVVQDYQMTETAEVANILLPASFPIESDGSFTNTQKVLQQFSKAWEPSVEQTNYEQLINLAKLFDVNGLETVSDVFLEIVRKLSQSENKDYEFTITKEDNYNMLFNHGCDSLMMRIDQEFENQLQ
jgi:predicted molibdopterin-dependent oxidoreductase YjgC